MELIDEQDWDIRKFLVYEDPSWICGFDGKDVPLLAIVQIEDMREWGCDFENDPNPWWVELNIIPKPDIMSEKFIDDVKSSSGGYCSAVDIIEYSGGIPISLNSVVMNINTPYKKDGRGVRISDNVNFDEFIKEFIEPQFFAIFGLIGFYLDNPWNRIGTTGWDSIEQYLTGKSAIELTMERHKNVGKN